MGEGNIFSSLGLIFFFYHREKILCPNKMGRGVEVRGNILGHWALYFITQRGEMTGSLFFHAMLT